MPEMKLSWQPSFSLARKPAKRPAPRRKKRHTFEIVLEHPEGRRRARGSPSVATSTHLDSPSNVSRVHTIIGGTPEAWDQSQFVEEDRPYPHLPLETSDDEPSYDSEELPCLETAGKFIEPHLNVCNVEHNECYAADAGFNALAAPVSVSTNDGTSHLIFVPPTLEFNSLVQRFRPILDRCMHSVQISFSTLTDHSRQSGVLYDPIDVSPKNQPVSVSCRPRPGTALPGSCCDGSSWSPCQERLDPWSSP